jgi:hypothetical protein
MTSIEDEHILGVADGGEVPEQEIVEMRSMIVLHLQEILELLRRRLHSE